jgi:hypothetical protein
MPLIEAIDQRTILGRLVKSIVCRDNRAHPRHVVDYDNGIPRNILAHMSRNHSGVRVETATCRMTDENRNRFTSIKACNSLLIVSGRLFGMRICRKRDYEDKRNNNRKISVS